MNLVEKLEQGIAAAKAGRKKEARRLLKEVVKADENQVEAWWWLSQVVYSLEEKSICLENVLTLNPDHQFAQEELTRVQSEQEEFFAPTYMPGEEEPPPQVAEIPKTFEEPVTDLYPHKSEFANEWLCPYCLAVTHPKDKNCPTCRQALIIKRRVKEERTVSLWRAFFLQLTIAFFTLAIGAGIFTILVKLNGLRNPVPFLPLYFWLPVDQPENVSNLMLAIFPRWVFWGLIIFSFYSFILMILLYIRIPYGNVVYLISGCALVLLGMLGAVLYYGSFIGVAASVTGIFLGAGQLFLSSNMWGDFLFEQGRMRLKLDRDAKTNVSLYLSARKYMKLEMWGLAVIHLRQVAFRAPKDVTYHAGLTLAYMRVKRYDLAEKTINNLKKFAPNAPEIWHLQQELGTALQNQNLGKGQ